MLINKIFIERRNKSEKKSVTRQPYEKEEKIAAFDFVNNPHIKFYLHSDSRGDKCGLSF
jgi:hypothetical protein